MSPSTWSPASNAFRIVPSPARLPYEWPVPADWCYQGSGDGIYCYRIAPHRFVAVRGSAENVYDPRYVTAVARTMDYAIACAYRLGYAVIAGRRGKR